MKNFLTQKLPQRERGSALAELLVLSIAMIPLMFMVPMLGKLMDLRHTAIGASRYVAWEQAMGAASSNVSRTTPVVGARFFASPESAIETTPSQTESMLALSGENTQWGSNTVRREIDDNASSFWAAFNFQDSVQSHAPSLVATLQDNSLSGVAGAVSDSINNIASVLDFAEGVRWDLGGGDYSTGTIDIEAKVGNLLLPAGGQCMGALRSGGSQSNGQSAADTESSVCFSESTAILSDTWGVPDSENVEDAIESHTQSFVPAVVLQPVGRFLSLLGNLPVVEELADLEHAFGYVDASQLPAGRSLGTYPE